MVSNIRPNSRNEFSERELEKARQRIEQVQARNANQSFVRLPSESGLARPVSISSSFGRR